MDAESKPSTESTPATTDHEETGNPRHAPAADGEQRPAEAAGPEVSHPEKPADSKPPEPPGLLARMVRWFSTDLNGR